MLTLSRDGAMISGSSVSWFPDISNPTTPSKSSAGSDDRRFPARFRYLSDPGTWKESERDSMMLEEKSRTAREERSAKLSRMPVTLSLFQWISRRCSLSSVQTTPSHPPKHAKPMFMHG